MKNLFITIAIVLGVMNAYAIKNLEPPMGGVRGGERTGFVVMEGDSITIGTSTPTLADIHVYRTSATGTIAIDGDVLGCLRILDTDAGGYTNITALNGTIGTSTDADCGF